MLEINSYITDYYFNLLLSVSICAGYNTFGIVRTPFSRHTVIRVFNELQPIPTCFMYYMCFYISKRLSYTSSALSLNIGKITKHITFTAEYRTISRRPSFSWPRTANEYTIHSYLSGNDSRYWIR
jgi:hypothetical protein